MDIQQLCGALQACMSPNMQERQAAEAALKQVHSDLQHDRSSLNDAPLLALILTIEYLLFAPSASAPGD